MRTISFKEACINGLAPFSDIPVNAPFLAQARNRMCCSRGAKDIPAVPFPVTGASESMAWPHMQLAIAGRKTLLFTATNVYDVDSSYAASAITTYNGTSQASTKPIAAGTGFWQTAGAYDSWFATKGNAFVYSAPSNTGGNVMVVDTTLTVNAICEHQGQLFLGGIGGTQMSDATWLDLFNLWKSISPPSVFTSSTAAWDMGWVFYGPPGGMGSQYPHDQLLAALGIPSTTFYAEKYQEEVRTLFRDGIMGFVPITRAGEVRSLKGYGDSVIAYCENCVVRLSRLEDGRWVEAGVIIDEGVPSRSAVAGTDTQHFAVVKSGDIWTGQLNQGWENLHYAHLMNTLTLSSIVVTHDQMDGYTWFSDGDDCFIKTREGMGNSNALCPSSAIRINATAGRIGTAVRRSDPQTAIVESNLFYSGTRRNFQTLWLEVVGQYLDTGFGTAYMKARKDKRDALTSFSALAVDIGPRGKARVATSGIEMAAVIEHPDHTLLDLDWFDAIITEGDMKHSDAKWYI